MVNLISYCLLIIPLFGLSLCLIEPGKCIDSPVISNFDVNRYYGLWYTLERFDYFWEIDLICTTAKYAAFNSTGFSITNSGVNKNTQQFQSIEGFAKAPNSATPNQLTITLPVVVNNVTLTENTGSYNVWLTDYSTYSVVYSCSQTIPPNLLKTERLWILSRAKTIDSKVLDSIKQFLQTKGVSANQLKTIPQNCN